MAWLLVIPVFMIAFVVDPGEDHWIGSWGIFGRAGIGILAGLLVAVSLWFSASFMCTACMDVEYILYDTKGIASLDSTPAFSNGYHPISGQVGVRDKYYFVEKGDESRQKDSIDAYYASIVRSDLGTPRIEFYSPEWEVEALSWFASPLVDDIYKIYIPENDLI